MNPFICPHCRQQHHYLRDLLTCCPRELRALTDVLELTNVASNDYSVRQAVTGKAIPPRIVAIMDAIRRTG